MIDSIFFVSAGITFAIVSIYETLDFISIVRYMKQEWKGRLFMGTFTIVLAMFFLLIGYWLPKKEGNLKFYRLKFENFN